MYLALREPLGPLVVPRHLTVDGVKDLAGHAVTEQTVEITPTITEQGGVVSGQVLQADGAPAAFASVRLFYEFDCGEARPKPPASRKR